MKCLHTIRYLIKILITESFLQMQFCSELNMAQNLFAFLKQSFFAEVHVVKIWLNK